MTENSINTCVIHCNVFFNRFLFKLLKQLARFIFNIIFNNNYYNLCLYLDQILFTSVVDIMCEDEEGNGDDELAMSELVTEEDEILKVSRILHTL